MTSIRRQLIIGLLAVVALAAFLGAAAVYRQARAELDQMFDYQLKQMALSLADQSFGGAFAGSVPEDFDFAIQVWSRDGVRLYLSRPQAVLPARARLGFDTVETDAGTWRVFSHEQRGLVFQVAQPMRVREHFAAAAALRTIAPVLLLLPALGLLVWLTVGRGLRPLEAVAAEVEARTPSALSPVADRDLPREVRPLVAALAVRHRLPAIYPRPDYVAAGGLMSYGMSLPDMGRRVAFVIDRVLKGANPAEIPVELPTRFELVVSLSAARALGIEVPAALLARADEVIE